jgi:hypothetical protein
MEGTEEMTEKLQNGVPPLLRLWEARPKDFIALLCVGACWYLYQDIRAEFRARSEESRRTAEVLVELTAAIREHNPRLDHIERHLEVIRDGKAHEEK